MSAEGANKPPPLISPPLPPAGPLEPTFWRAWRGVWLFTWRGQLAWRRLPIHLVMLLAIPALVYITVSADFPFLFGNSGGDAHEFANRLRMGRARLPREESDQLRNQIDQLRDVFSEEYGRADSQWRSSLNGHRNERPSTVDMVSAINSGFDAITNRAQSILVKKPQLAAFDTFVRQKRQQYVERVESPDWGRTAPFYQWLIDFYFFMMLPLACVSSCGALIRDEIQADTLGFLTTRPLSRARLLVIKYLSQTLWLQIMALAEVLILFTAGELRGVPGLGSLLLLLLPVQFLAVFAWGALGALAGQATQRYMAASLIYGLIVELGIGRIPTNINTLSLMRHLKSLLGQNTSLEKLFDWPLRGVPLSVGALVLATGVFLGIAAFLFTVREYNPTSEMQK